MKQSRYTVQDAKEAQIDVTLLWHVFIGNLWKILLVGILSAGLLGSFRYLTNHVTYSSNVKFLINGVTLTKIDNQYTYISNSSGAMNSGSLFAMNAPEIISGSKTLSLVKDYLVEKKTDSPYHEHYSRMKPKEFGGMLRVSYEEQIVIVSITHRNQVIALEVAEAFRCVIPNQMNYFYGVNDTYINRPVSTETTADTSTETTSAETTPLENGQNQYESAASVAKALNKEDADYLVKTGRGSILYATIGFILGSFSVFAICFLRAYFDNTVYTEDDLKNFFNLPVLGQIPGWDSAADTNDVHSSYNTGTYGAKTVRRRGKKNVRKPVAYAPGTNGKPRKHRKKDMHGNSAESTGQTERDYIGRLVNNETPFAITEAFKSLRTNMCYTTKGEKCAVYGITSAYVQAGKSLVIANLAVSFSMMNKKVLLLDGDLRCPVQHKIFNITNRIHGLSDILAGICNYEDVEIRNGGYPNLSILTCGKLPPNPAELLASESMRRFLERARMDYDFIFIDLPPVSEVSDAGIISELVTGFAFVVRAAYSDRRMVEMALQTMEGFDASIIGFILNDIDIKSGNYYKNKYYSYGNRYGKYGRDANHGAYGEYGTAYDRRNTDAE